MGLILRGLAAPAVLGRWGRVHWRSRMLERSELGDRAIATCLHDRYGLDGVEIKFLPLGNDSSAWVYRVFGPVWRGFLPKGSLGPPL